MSIFQRILSASDVEHFATDLLQKWSSTYIAEVERQHGMDGTELPRIRSWSTVNTFENWPADQLPASLLISTGTVGAPSRSGDGEYTASFALGVAVICASNNASRSNELAKLYIAAHRAILVQRPSLERGAFGVDWLGDDFTDLAAEDGRFLSAGMAEFVVEMRDVVHAKAGPTTPDDPSDDPWPNWPLTETVDIEVEKVATDESLPVAD